jgi:hypothetical protein
MNPCDYCGESLRRPGLLANKKTVDIGIEHVKGGPDYYTHWSCWDAFIKNGCKPHPEVELMNCIDAYAKAWQEAIAKRLDTPSDTDSFDPQ